VYIIPLLDQLLLVEQVKHLPKRRTTDTKSQKKLIPYTVGNAMHHSVEVRCLRLYMMTNYIVLRFWLPRSYLQTCLA